MGVITPCLAQELSTKTAGEKLPNNQVVATIGLGSLPGGVVVSPDSSTVYVIASGTQNDQGSLWAIDAATNQVANTNQISDTYILSPYPSFLALSPDGSTLFLVATISYYNTKGEYITYTALLAFATATLSNNNSVAFWYLPYLPTYGLAVSPDGTKVYVPASNSTIYVADTGTNDQLEAPIAVGSAPFWVTFAPNGAVAYVPDQANVGLIQMINPSTGVVSSGALGAGSLIGPQAMAISPDGTKLYVADQYDYLATIDLAKNRLIAAAPLVTPGATDTVLGQPVVTPNGLFVYVPNSTNGTVTMIDATTGKVKGAPIQVGTNPFFAAIAPNGNLLYVVNSNPSGQGTLSVIDITTP